MSYDTQSPEDRQAQLQLDEIQKQLPYVTFEEDGCATFIDGSLTMGMELFPHHLDLSTNNEINALQTALANAMNGLPAGFAVQFELLCSTDCTVQLAKHFKKDTQWAEDMELFKIERELNHHYYLQRAKAPSGIGGTFFMSITTSPSPPGRIPRLSCATWWSPPLKASRKRPFSRRKSKPTATG
jgi:hypothetical protein